MNSVVIVQDGEGVAQAAASLFLDAAREHLSERGSVLNWMLSGGSTPGALYRLLAFKYPRAIDWSRVRFFWGDERGVPPDDPESNFRLAKKSLLDPLRIQPDHIFRFETETGSPAQVAAAYERTLRSALLNSEQHPHLHSALMGLGEDGHTASLFPDARNEWAAADQRGDWTCAPWVPHLQSHRLTVLPRILGSAKQMIFLVSGLKKARILKRVLEDPSDPASPKYPAQIFLSNAIWVVDRPAANLLSQAA